MRPPQAAASTAAWDALVLDGLLDDAMNETDALLVELLREPPPRSSVARQSPPAEDELGPRAAPRKGDEAASVAIPNAASPLQASKRPRSIQYHSKTKDAIATLRVEVSQLTNEFKRLRAETSTAVAPHVRTAKEAAITERLKRRRVEDECRQLREAVYAQTQFLRGLRAVFAMPMPLGPMDLTHYLHNYTRLPRDRSTRWNEYAALAQEARFQSAMDILCRETQKLKVEDEGTGARPSIETPVIHTEILRHSGRGSGFGVTSTSVYALETNDLSAALRGVCVAVSEIVAQSHAYECFGRKKQLVDLDASLPSVGDGSNIAYRVMGVDHKIDENQVAVESHNVTLYKQTDDFALLLEDFVDHDELHPHDETADVTRQAVGAYLIRRETCDDGVERAVCRVMRTRRYRFHEHTPRAILQRFQQLSSARLHTNDLLVRRLIHEAIAQEEVAYTQALRQLEAFEPAATADS